MCLRRTIGHEAETGGDGAVAHQQEGEREGGEEREVEEEGDVGVEAVYSGQSEIERAVMEATTSPSELVTSLTSVKRP